MVKHVNVPFDEEILDFYKNEGIVGLDNESEFKKEMLKKMSIYRDRIKDKKVGKHISFLYNQLKNYTGSLNCVVLDGVVNSFEEHLRKNTGQNYKINLVVDGNL